MFSLKRLLIFSRPRVPVWRIGMVSQRSTSPHCPYNLFYQLLGRIITLSPLQISTNKCCVNDIFGFAQEIREINIELDYLLASYNVTALFTNMPLEETINILADRAFHDDWFNKSYNLRLKKCQLVELLQIATTRTNRWCRNGLPDRTPVS